MGTVNADKQHRSFGLMVGSIFVVIGFWPFVIRGEALRLWALVIGVLLIIPGLMFPRSLAPIYKVWMAVGQVLGWINSRIILGVVFYGLLTPMGLVMRLMGRDPMRRDFQREADTYRVLRKRRPSAHMLRQF